MTDRRGQLAAGICHLSSVIYHLAFFIWSSQHAKAGVAEFFAGIDQASRFIIDGVSTLG